MTSARKKTIKAGELGMFFMELGHIPTVPEYRSFSKAPMRWSMLKRFYGNWNRMLRFMSQMQPDIWTEVQNLPPSELVVSDEEALATLNYDLEAKASEIKRKMEEALKSKPAKDAVED